jgi:DNA helicase HerA-like ATPase
LNVADVISKLEVGEALVSTLQEKGVPMPVERVLMAPPRCRMGSITQEERDAVRRRSPIGGKYDTAVNRESAYEILNKRTATTPASAPAAPSGGTSKSAPAPEAPAQASSPLNDFIWGTKRRQGMVETMAKQAARTVGSQMGRQILRGVLGGLLGSTRSR